MKSKETYITYVLQTLDSMAALRRLLDLVEPEDNPDMNVSKEEEEQELKQAMNTLNQAIAAVEPLLSHWSTEGETEVEKRSVTRAIKKALADSRRAGVDETGNWNFRTVTRQQLADFKAARPRKPRINPNKSSMLDDMEMKPKKPKADH